MLAVAGAALLVWSGVIHLQLWSDGYRDISVIGPLFLIQGIASIALALPLVIFRRLVLLAAGAVMLAATAAGLLLSAGIGLFGYQESLAVPYAGSIPGRGVHGAPRCSWLPRYIVPIASLATRRSHAAIQFMLSFSGRTERVCRRWEPHPTGCRTKPCSRASARATPSWRWRSCAASSGSSSASRWPSSATRSTAEDVAQQAFEQAWRHAQVYDSRRGSVRAWLTTITHNLAVDVRPCAHSAPVDPDDLPAVLTAVTDTPERVAVANDSAAGLRRDAGQAASAAGAGRGDGWHLRHDGAAGRRQWKRIPLGTAKTRIRDGMQKLRAAYLPEEVGDE